MSVCPVQGQGSGKSQDFTPLTNICHYLNAFHVNADDTSRFLNVHHYCAPLDGGEIRQCLLYDSNKKDAKLLGVEYMITEKLFLELPAEEKKLWHTHVYEVQSGMMIMPKPPAISEAEWEKFETKEMEAVSKTYGKIYQFWQIDKGHKLPMGPPSLWSSFTADGQIDFAKECGKRDKELGTDYNRKRELRKHLQAPVIHPDADQCWKKK
ncbi:hypothetical protein DFH27DRAFT_531459 [Peziza echinospora]|nr:hypothetical protein DFH27DRAFT_531459 [Peziza echinospora]